MSGGFGQASHTYLFHMRGGQTIRVPYVVSLTMKTENSTGRFVSYSIAWATGKKPAFFSLVLDDISAVTVEER